MTDYSVWIYAMLAVGALITAAVIYTLSQPSDLPYLKKKQIPIALITRKFVSGFLLEFLGKSIPDLLNNQIGLQSAQVFFGCLDKATKPCKRFTF